MSTDYFEACTGFIVIFFLCSLTYLHNLIRPPIGVDHVFLCFVFQAETSAMQSRQRHNMPITLPMKAQSSQLRAFKQRQTRHF